MSFDPHAFQTTDVDAIDAALAKLSAWPAEFGSPVVRGGMIDLHRHRLGSAARLVAHRLLLTSVPVGEALQSYAPMVSRLELSPGWSWRGVSLDALREVLTVVLHDAGDSARSEGVPRTDPNPLKALPRLSRLHLVAAWPEVDLSGFAHVTELTLEKHATMLVPAQVPPELRVLRLRHLEDADVDLASVPGLRLIELRSSPRTVLEGLPALEHLVVCQTFGGPRALRTTERLPAGLETLAMYVDDADRLPGLLAGVPNLRRLSVRNTDALQVGSLPNLESFSALKCTFAQGLGNQPALTSLRLRSCRGEALRGGSFPKLRRLELDDCDLRTLDGCAGVPLEEVVIQKCHSLKDVSAIGKAPLQKVVIEACSDLRSGSGLAKVPPGQLTLRQTGVDTDDPALASALGRRAHVKRHHQKPKPLKGAGRTRLSRIRKLLGHNLASARSGVELLRALDDDVVADALLLGVEFDEDALLPGYVLHRVRAGHRTFITREVVAFLPQAEALRAQVDALDVTPTPGVKDDLRALCQFPNLQRLVVRVTAPFATGPDDWPALPGLESLELRDVHHPVVLARMPKLERLRVVGARVPVSLVDTALEELELVGPHMPLMDLVKQTKVKSLVLRDACELTGFAHGALERVVASGEGVVAGRPLSELPSLRHLDLVDARGIGNAAGLFALPKLEWLSLPPPQSPADRGGLREVSASLRHLTLRGWDLNRDDYVGLEASGIETLTLREMPHAFAALPDGLRARTVIETN